MILRSISFILSYMRAFQKFHKSKLRCSSRCTFKILILFQITSVSRIFVLPVIFLSRTCLFVWNCKPESIGELITRRDLSARNFPRNSSRIRPFSLRFRMIDVQISRSSLATAPCIWTRISVKIELRRWQLANKSFQSKLAFHRYRSPFRLDSIRGFVNT